MSTTQEVKGPLYSPVPVSSYPALAVMSLAGGLLLTGLFFVYEVTVSKRSRQLLMELVRSHNNPHICTLEEPTKSFATHASFGGELRELHHCQQSLAVPAAVILGLGLLFMLLWSGVYV